VLGFQLKVHRIPAKMYSGDLIFPLARAKEVLVAHGKCVYDAPNNFVGSCVLTFVPPMQQFVIMVRSSEFLRRYWHVTVRCGTIVAIARRCMRTRTITSKRRRS
jgi:hypothetical protein